VGGDRKTAAACEPRGTHGGPLPRSTPGMDDAAPLRQAAHLQLAGVLPEVCRDPRGG